MKKVVCLVLVLVFALSAFGVNAGYEVYPDGKITSTVTFHNGSSWYVRNDKWISDPDLTCEFKENGDVYVQNNTEINGNMTLTVSAPQQNQPQRKMRK